MKLRNKVILKNFMVKIQMQANLKISCQLVFIFNIWKFLNKKLDFDSARASFSKLFYIGDKGSPRTFW